MKLHLLPQKELAPEVPIDLSRSVTRVRGRRLEDFVAGEVRLHPRGFTFRAAEMHAFARTFLQANPIYLNAEEARRYGHADCPASQQMVFNVLLSLGVENDSEAAIANLGYYNASFLRPVYDGDTLIALSRVAEVRDRGPGKPGVVHIQTLARNQHDQVVAQLERQILVDHRTGPPEPRSATQGPDFPWHRDPEVELNLPALLSSPQLTLQSDFFEDFTPGDILVHGNSRTITDEHFAWTYRVGNTHPLHSDRLYSAAQPGPLSGEPVVYGGLVFSWLDGLSSRDLSANAVWDLGFTEGYHTQPSFAGDTLSALSRILATEPIGDELGIVNAQLIGVKNLTSAQALARNGESLFAKENSKPRSRRIPEKVFEIERRLLLRRRAPLAGQPWRTDGHS